MTTESNTETTATTLTTATAGANATVHYRGTLEDGSEFDNSRTRGEPITFTVGSGEMIAGFNAAVDGMSVGETKTVTLTPDQAYGEINPEAQTTFPKSGFPEGLELVENMPVPLKTPDGRTLIGRLTEQQEDTVTIDLNHPLAGQTLQFEIELVEVTTTTTTTTTTDEEIAT
jgi:FKBP-type peptidyl-prolyl cis-trans isomerase 2